MANQASKPWIILDKSALQGCTAEDLARFATSYRILLPWVLFYEIATQETSAPGDPDWTSYCRKLIKVRPIVCARRSVLIAEEQRTCQPIREIVDHADTATLRTWLDVPIDRWLTPPLFIEPAEYNLERQQSVDWIRSNCRRIRSTPKVVRGIKGIPKLMEEEDCSRERAFSLVLGGICPARWKQLYPRLPTLASRKSMSFMYFVLLNYCVLHSSLDDLPRVSDNNLFNRVLDLDYLLYLVAAGGIVSRDRRMREIAKGFFPNRLVFDSVRSV